MIEQNIEVAQTSANVTVQAVQTFLNAETGRYQAACEIALAAGLLQQERNKDGLALMSSRTAAERTTDAFVDALAASGKVTDKTIRNLRTDFTKLADYANKRMLADKSLTTLALTSALYSAEFERVEGFKPSVQAISAALTLANGTGKAKAKTAKPQASEETSQEAVSIKADATADAKWSGIVKALSAMLADPENHAMIAADTTFGDVLTLAMKVRRETVQGDQQEKIAA